MKPVSEKEKRNEKILKRFEKMIAEGWPRMEAYKAISKKYSMSVGGIRYAIQAARANRTTSSLPRPKEYVRVY